MCSVITWSSYSRCTIKGTIMEATQKELSTLTVAQLKNRLKIAGIAVPTIGSGAKGNIIKADLIDALLVMKGEENVRIRNVLPSEMIRTIALKTSPTDIIEMCRTDQSFHRMCKDLSFWNEYFDGSQDKFHSLTVHLFQKEDYNTFLFLWKNLDKISINRDTNTYMFAYNAAVKLDDNDLATNIWRFAPIEKRSRFHQDIVYKLNDFFKQWHIAPRINEFSEGSESFYFVKQPFDEEDDEFYDIELYEDMDPIAEWEILSQMILFTGEFYQLSTIAYYLGGPKFALEFNTRDTISRAFRKDTKLTVVEVFRQIAYLGYDPRNKATGNAGFIKKLKIDETAKYPTLLIDFEVS